MASTRPGSTAIQHETAAPASSRHGELEAPVTPAAAPPEAMPDSLRGLSLRRNFVWTATGNVVYAGCQWGMLMALAKLGTPEMVGQFALGLAIGAPVMLLANLQLRAVIATDVRSEYLFGEYLGLRLVSTGIAFALITAIAILSGYRPETAWVVVLVGLAKSVESVSDIVYGVFQKYERLDRIAIAMILRGVGSVVCFTLVMRATGKVEWAAAALVACWSAVLATYEWKTGRALLKVFGQEGEGFAPAWTWPRLRKLSWLSLPLGLVMVLASLGLNLPRYFVQHRLGEAALGYFAALAYVMLAGYTVMNALGQSAAPRLARYFVTNRPAYVRLLGKMLAVALLLGMGAIVLAAVWGRTLLTLLYRADYAAHRPLFIWLMIAAAFYYIAAVFGHGMTSARVFRPQVWLWATGALGILVVCWFGIEKYGLLAGAWALGTGGIIVAAGSVLVLFRHLAETPQIPAGDPR